MLPEETADSRTGSGKIQDVFVTFYDTIKFSKNDGDLSIGHSKQLEGAPTGQVWNEINSISNGCNPVSNRES